MQKTCSSCEQRRLLWASEEICACCALEWSFKKRELTSDQIKAILEKDKEVIKKVKPSTQKMETTRLSKPTLLDQFLESHNLRR